MLILDDVLELCAGFRGAVEDYPFGDDVTVFKVGGKMFALLLLVDEPAHRSGASVDRTNQAGAVRPSRRAGWLPLPMILRRGELREPAASGNCPW